MPVAYHRLLVQTPAGLALIDTGAGLALAEEPGEPVGRLPEALGAAAVAADDLALALLHVYPDHSGGLSSGAAPAGAWYFPAPGRLSAGPDASTGLRAGCPAISAGWANWPASTCSRSSGRDCRTWSRARRRWRQKAV